MRHGALLVISWRSWQRDAAMEAGIEWHDAQLSQSCKSFVNAGDVTANPQNGQFKNPPFETNVRSPHNRQARTAMRLTLGDVALIINI
jgi:hypothetical protein